MKILLLDIETAPSKGYVWSLWSELRSVTFIEQDWFIMCWCAKWLDEKEVYSSSLTDFRSYKKDSENDKEALKKLWKLLNQADVVVAHNGVKFDKRKINARFVFHGMTPPSPYRLIDTLLIARSEFAFTSNKLNDIAQFLRLGRKHDTDGFDLWKRCLNGERKAWKKMVDYCKQDIVLLERVYLALRPYIVQHPNIGVYIEEAIKLCPKCGSDSLQYRGYSYTNVSKFHRFVCTDCGGWGRDRSNCHDLDKRKTLTTNAV